VRSPALTILLLAGAIGLCIPGRDRAQWRAAAAAPPRRALAGQTPAVVADGVATRRGHHDPAAPLTLNIGLAVRDAAALDGVIAAASDPASPEYGHYLTNAQYMARFAPTDAAVQAVRDWATGAGLAVGAVSPDHLLVTVRGTTGAAERALGVRIDDYHAQGRDFRSNDRDATVPAGLDIRAISGLSTLHRFHTTLTHASTLRSGGYYPNDFRAAYNVGPVGDGSGQTIGLTLWGAPVAQSDLDTFAVSSSTPAIVAGQPGANGIDWIPVDGASAYTGALDETAMDVEYAHGVAPNSHLKYWLAATTCDQSGNTCQPTDQGLEDAVNAAANDPEVRVVSNSWGGDPATSTSDPFVSSLHASFQHAAAVGTTFYFSSGDGGANSACDPRSPQPGCGNKPSYPADDPYVVSVGGTSLPTNGDGTYGAESAWSGSGGGCSVLFDRPSWQTGVDAATTQPGGAPCTKRAEPDVAADANPNTGASVYFNGGSQQLGGTSLAAPLWAGMSADMNRYLAGHGQQPMGWAAPRLYTLATNSATYGRDFHDVTSGSNDYPAGPNWDEATGWGSPNLTNLATDWNSVAPAPTVTPPPSATPVPSATLTVPSLTPGAGATTMPSPSSTAPAITCGLPCQGTAIPTATSTGLATPAPTVAGVATTTPIPTSTAVPAPTATPPYSPTPISTVMAPPAPTSTTVPAPTATATATPSATPTGTATPSATPTATNSPVPSATNTAVTVAAAPSAVATASIKPTITGGPAPVATIGTPAPQRVNRSSGGVRSVTPTVLAATVSVSGTVTRDSVVTVSGRARPGASLSITTSLTTTTTIAQKIVVYVAAAGARGPRPASRTAKAAPCRKGARGCVARTVVRRVARTTLLYRTSTSARVDRQGRFSARIQLRYGPRATVRATLTLTVAASYGHVTHSARVTVTTQSKGEGRKAKGEGRKKAPISRRRP